MGGGASSDSWPEEPRPNLDWGVVLKGWMGCLASATCNRALGELRGKGLPLEQGPGGVDRERRTNKQYHLGWAFGATGQAHPQRRAPCGPSSSQYRLQRWPQGWAEHAGVGGGARLRSGPRPSPQVNISHSLSRWAPWGLGQQHLPVPSSPPALAPGRGGYRSHEGPASGLSSMWGSDLWSVGHFPSRQSGRPPSRASEGTHSLHPSWEQGVQYLTFTRRCPLQPPPQALRVSGLHWGCRLRTEACACPPVMPPAVPLSNLGEGGPS